MIQRPRVNVTGKTVPNGVVLLLSFKADVYTAAGEIRDTGTAFLLQLEGKRRPKTYAYAIPALRHLFRATRKLASS